MKRAIAMTLGWLAAAGVTAAQLTPETALPSGEYLLTVTRPATTLNIVDVENEQLVKQCALDAAPGSGTLVLSPDQSIAYVLANRFGDVYGIELDSCKLVFSTQQSTGNIRVKSLGSLTLSKDGKHLYTHQNRVQRLNDRYQLLPPTVAEFDTTAGLNVKASRAFDAPRQVTIMDTLDNGDLLLGGRDIYRMNPTTGEYTVHMLSANADDPAYASRDVLTVWPMGTINNEFIRLFSTARWGEEVGNLETAEWLWGYESVDLASGDAKSTIFGPLEVVLFSGARRPSRPELMYGTLNFLKVFDINKQEEVKSIPLDHSYYTLNFSKDGQKVMLLGADADIAFYDADSLEKGTVIPLPGDGSMSNNVVFTKSN